MVGLKTGQKSGELQICEEPVRISQAAPRGRGNPPPSLTTHPFFPYPAPAYSRSSSGAQIVGNGQGPGTPFGRNPTPAHAHFAELGLAPRPEGKESSRLKASRILGHDRGQHYSVERWLLITLDFYPSRDDDFFFLPIFYFSALVDPIPRRFYRPHEMNESRCAHGVRRVWCSDEKKRSNCSSSLRSHDMLHANIATEGGQVVLLSLSQELGGWEHEPGMCMPSINVRRRCIKISPPGVRLANGTPI